MYLLLVLAVCASADILHYNSVYDNLATPLLAGAYRTYSPGYNYATYNYNPVAYKSYAAAIPAVSYVAGNNFKYDVASAHPAQVQVVKQEVATPVVYNTPVVKTYETVHQTPVVKTVATHVATPTAAVVAAPSVYKYAATPAAAYVAKTYGAGYATSQYHQQDVAGQYKFGYKADTSARDEVKTADGVVQGQYSYIDANGLPQQVNYVADAAGFRVAATNLPVDTNTPVAAAAVHTAAVPVATAAVVDTPAIVEAKYLNHGVVLDDANPHVPYTPEVAHARASHLAALAAASTRVKRAAARGKYGAKSYGKSYGKVFRGNYRSVGKKYNSYRKY